MAIRKPITKRRDVEPDEEEVVSKPKKLIKKPAPVEEEEEEEPADEEEETPPPKKKLIKKSAPVEEEEEEEEPAPRKGSKLVKKKKRSLAEIFDSTKPGRGGMPPGDYVMYINGYEFIGEIAEDPDDQEDLKIKVTYEGDEDQDEGIAGKTISNTSIIWKDGEAGPGIQFFLGDLDVLGYEQVTLADLEEIFEQIRTERPKVVVKVKQNGQYTNAYLQGLADGE